MTMVERLRSNGCSLCDEAADEIEMLGELVLVLNRRLTMAESQMRSVVHTVGGEIEGQPTGAHNILQRIRQLRDIEANGADGDEQ